MIVPRSWDHKDTAPRLASYLSFKTAGTLPQQEALSKKKEKKKHSLTPQNVVSPPPPPKTEGPSSAQSPSGMHSKQQLLEAKPLRVKDQEPGSEKDQEVENYR